MQSVSDAHSILQHKIRLHLFPAYSDSTMFDGLTEVFGIM
jgi:hypothetical protein